MIGKLRTALPLALVAFGLTAALTTPADAAPAAPAASQTYTCFGHTGTFIANTGLDILDLGGNGAGSWPDGTRACYGITPSHAIYQIAATSGQWYPIPGNGLADTFTLPNGYAEQGGVKRLCVETAAGNYYYDDFTVSSWHGWYQVFTSYCGF